MTTDISASKIDGIKKSVYTALWFMFLTFPIMVIKVNTIDNIIIWRWENMFFIGAGSFILSFIWRYMISKNEMKSEDSTGILQTFSEKITSEKKIYIPIIIAAAVFVIAFPFIFSMYNTNIMITALIYVMLGLGLNIVVGISGHLFLGYAAFYAAGAYTYALLNHHFDISFWFALPIGAAIGAVIGILLGFPVLRLKGDYLAIVTLGFGEIVRLILENWNDFSFGPSGIANIPRPPLFNLKLSLSEAIVYLYFIMVVLCIFTVFIIRRLEDSRIGRALVALREDETACQAMGIDKTKIKLTAFALGTTWAGMGGVLFAAKTTFVNPSSFTIWESIMVLCIVVLGGMGSIVGVIIGAMILILLPEYLRAFSEYRMIIFGIVLVLMMIFRPGGIVTSVRKNYKFELESK
ncbi:MAG: branched-chain amino acid ABC transporter permease [Deltaproteobacteria bacterium]|nr:branched-chain amino acid ABC transporter permease [Deltaproteobacteria bacterium]